MSKTSIPEAKEVKEDLHMSEQQPSEVCESDINQSEDQNNPSDCEGTKDKEREKLDTKKLLEENEQLKKELGELKDIYQRMLAEYANYKRRTELEKEQLGGFVKSETIKELLPALDNLERAVDAPPGDEYKKGIEMIIRQLVDILKELGLEEISPAGETFDPEFHHAVMREDAEDIEPETVTEVYQKGYKMGNRLLRPAMVKVAN